MAAHEATYPSRVPTFEYTVNGEIQRVEADRWYSDLPESDAEMIETVFVQKVGGGEQEVRRLQIDNGSVKHL